MAEEAVNLVLERLIGFIEKEAELIRGVHNEVGSIKLELDFISNFIREAEESAMGNGSNNDNGLRTWVKHIREVSYDIEDAIDEYTLYMATNGQDQHGFKAFLQKIINCLNLKRPRDIAMKIQELKTTIKEIGETADRYGYKAQGPRGSINGVNKRQLSQHEVPEAGLYFHEDAPVGIDGPKKKLVDKLIHGTDARTVISLVGMGGIGKSTLAKSVHDDPDVKNHFKCHAWITLSQSYSTVERLRTMIRKLYNASGDPLPNGIDAMDVEELINTSKQHLHDKSYVVVFDNVWVCEEIEKFWEYIENALPDKNHGRIIITTREMPVVEYCTRYSIAHVQNLEAWSPEQAQALLCRKAFHNDQSNQCPAELMALSFDIVRIIGHLPLAIVAIGGLLATKGRDVTDWEEIRDNLGTLLENDPHLAKVKKALSFSYHNLPHHLKSCLLYLGMFPQNHSIRCKRLLRLWIAEGLVKEKQNKTLEETGKEFLTMLVHRSLIQVEWTDSTRRIRSCRVHDLIYDVIRSKLEELNMIQFLQAHDWISTGRKARYLSIKDGSSDSSTNNGARDSSSDNRKCQTHSIIFFTLEKIPQLSELPSKHKLLREIDFESAPLEHIPEEFGNLFHLRYLSLKDTKVKVLPKSIGKLHNLLTLDLKDTFVKEIPIEVRKLRNLQYFAACSFNGDKGYNIQTVQGVNMDSKVISNLESIEKLYYVDFQAQGGTDFFRALEKLRRLRKLGINNITSDYGMALCHAIEQMPHLQFLRISAEKEDELLQLESISSPPPSLQRLRLQGRLQKLPDWVSKSNNLVKISLHWSGISGNWLKILGSLPKLLEFWLHEGYDGAKLHFEEGQFQKLKFLGLRSLFELNELVIDSGSLPCLSHLEVGPSPRLLEIPTNISNLECLETLLFADMSKNFARKILPQPNEGIIGKWPKFQMFVFNLALKDYVVKHTSLLIFVCMNI